MLRKESILQKRVMVRILANGDIVPDDDPRAQQASRRPAQGGPVRQERFQQAGNYDQQYGDPAQGQQISIFQILNQKLRNMGIPSWNIGETVIEPIVSVGFLIAFLFLGVHGLIFGLILFAVSQWSQHGAPEAVTRFFGGGGGGDGGNDQGRGNRHQGRAGGGYRLGR